ncbi:hypothetical protein TNCV_1344191 [Trichonephila clavipes]|nr:hypothetical protein TNCV_1344191 [Trichonephila clavipes]
MRRNEGRVVNTPLVFKRVLFQGKRKDKKRRTERKVGENGRKKRVWERENGRKEKGEETEGDEREEPALYGERKGLSPEIGEKKTMNAGGVENGI